MAVPKWARENMAKTGGMPTHGVVSKPSPFHSQDVKHLADGTPSEDEFKRMGLEASDRYNEIEKSQEVGALDKLKGGFGRLFDRIKAGNIDAPGSRAYEQYGAGLGKAEYEKQQQIKQTAADIEQARNDRKDYVPDTADSIARKMGRVTMGPTVEAPKDVAPPVANKDQDWQTFMKGETKPDAPAPEKKVFSTPVYPTVSTDKAEEVPAKNPPTLRKAAPKKAAPKKSDSGSGDKKVYLPNLQNPVRPDNSRPSVDNEARKTKPGSRGGNNEERKSKPFPAEAAAQNLGKRFKEADDALRADPKNAAKKKARDEALKRYENATKNLKR